MAVPEQVRKQTEAVQALYQDINAPADSGSPKGETGSKRAEEGAENKPADRADKPAAAPRPVEPGAGDAGTDWQQKYQTLQGMYNADVPRLNAQNQELLSRLHNMEELISAMQSAPPREEAAAPMSSLTAEELEEYGESIDVMRKVSQEIAGQYQRKISDLEGTVAQLRGSVVPRVEQIAFQQASSNEQAFWSGLEARVPDWREVNGSQAFQNWLMEEDPLSGITRQVYLDAAQRDLDVGRVAQFFSSWGQISGTSTARPNRSASQSELERQVTPGRSRSGGSPRPEDAKTYTPADIQKFFTDVRMGKFKGKESERGLLERDIFAAQREGRIVSA